MTSQCVNIVAVFLLCLQTFVKSEVEECSGEAEYSILGMTLRRHTFKKVTGAPLGNVCLRECYRDLRCQSFNYVISKEVCELNNRTKEARPEDFVPNSDRYYFKRDINRVRLGTIPDLPAESCNEIKGSEGKYAVNGNYWLHFLEIGKIALAYCDMKTEDVDECSASITFCDLNADCQNTPGSYRCQCKPGFTGDGKTCNDVDECSTSEAFCDVNADCKNTRGSYRCLCKPGFTGDGKTCNDVDECSASVTSCDVNADCQNTQGSYRCLCKPGFTGHGKTCNDIDECVSGVHDCHSSASCTNTVGSFSCSCNHPYFGDGKTCSVASECQQYQSLTDGERNSNFNVSHLLCDNSLGPGWFRFQGAAGTRIATSCVPLYRCGTNVPGWLTGGHPAAADGQVTRTVCFNWSSGCCTFSIDIQVRNCGAFYVYYFNSTPNNGQCNFVYCGTS